jgi:hypothetical protein
VLDHRTAELAGVELGRTALGEQLERVGKVAHHEPVAGDEALAVRVRVERAPLLRVPQDQVEDRVQVGLRAVQLDSLARELDRRREELAPRERPECAVRLLEPGRRAGDSARRGSDVEDLRRIAEGHVDVVHGRTVVCGKATAGDVDEEVEQPRAAVVAAVDDDEPAAARSRERALRDPRGEGRGDARVDRVPALGEHARARLGGQSVAGGDGSSHPTSVIGRWRHE